MKSKPFFSFIRKSITLVAFFVVLISASKSETINTWYSNAQQRIDTLRKASFGIKIVDKNGLPYAGNFSVKMAKHEFPFGIAFDLYEGAIANGNSYTTTTTVSANSDAEIYKSERWFSFLAYAIPVAKDKQYKVTLKFAEIYFDTKGSRIFNVFVEGNKFLSNYDVFAEAGGKNIAKDTSITITATDTLLNLEFISLVDNAAIKGIEVQSVEGDLITRINCGGGALTTLDGHDYKSDEGFFDNNASRVPTEEQWMKATMQKYFNYGVSGNSFKWSGIQPQHTTPNYVNFDNAVNWTKSIGWELRAHTLLWGGGDDHAMPAWVRSLPTPKAINDTCKMRVIREVSRYRGIVKEYDVINEPLHAKFLQDSLVGDSINWNCFKWARSADPDAELFVNDYNVEYNWGDAKKYRDLILKIKSMGAPVTGVGMQAHFWQNMRPQLTEFVTNLNIVAEAGLPIKLTEFDNGDISQEAQSSDLVMVYTVAFSHPSVNGIVNWALSDKGAWRTNSGFFTADHRPKKAADTLLYLTKKLWSTNFDTTTSGEAVSFKGYFGNYNVEVDFNGTTKIFTIPCIRANKDSVFVLNELNAIVKSPEVVAVQLVSDNSLKIDFNKEIQAGSVTKSDFKFFSDSPLRIQDIKVDTNSARSLIVSLQSPIAPNDYLSVFYFPGSLTSTDGGKVIAFGPEPVKNLTTGLISASVTNEGANIEAVFNAKLLNISENLSSFSITVDGKQAVANSLNYKNNDSSVMVFTLASSIAKGSKVTIKYTQGTLKPVNGYVCQTSSDMAVSNIWPALVKAEVTSKGTQITALFGTIIQDVINNKNAFTIMVDGNQVEISNISEAGTDSSRITFTLAKTIAKGSIVTFAYKPGTIKAFNGNSMAAIENVKVVNNSLTSIEKVVNNGLSIYPNPASDFVQISSDSDINTVSIFNSLGALVYNIQANSRSVNINTASFKKGIYMVKILDNKGNSMSSKVVLE